MKQTMISTLLKRMQTASPDLYKKLSRWAFSLSIPMGIISLISTEAPELIPQFPYVDWIVKLCKFATALFIGIGITSTTTTTEPSLMSKETKEAVIEDAIDKGKVTPNE